MPETNVVNVRAVVRCEAPAGTEELEVPGWEVYDVESREEEGLARATVRCDRHVSVEGDPNDVEDLARDARITAPAVEVPGWTVDQVDLWIDEDIDVNPEDADVPKP